MTATVASLWQVIVDGNCAIGAVHILAATTQGLTDYEKTFDGQPMVQFAVDHSELPVGLPFVDGGSRLFTMGSGVRRVRLLGACVLRPATGGKRACIE